MFGGKTYGAEPRGIFGYPFQNIFANLRNPKKINIFTEIYSNNNKFPPAYH